jgi:Tol biopolymer transport system component
MSADGSEQIRLISGACPSWSPDGKTIVFHSSMDTGSNGASIYSINVDGSNVVRLTNDSGRTDSVPSYSPDGKHIVFNRYNGYYSICIINNDGSGLYNLETGKSGSNLQPAWGP